MNLVFFLIKNSMIGNLEVICGPMFSGKSEELIRRIKRAQIANQRIQCFKPAIDNRYSLDHIVSHSHLKMEAITLKTAKELFDYLEDHTRIIAIDEVQFFDKDIVDVVMKLVKRSYRVILAGLDLDYKGNAFGPMPELLALADEVIKIHAICTLCGEKATRTERIIDEDSQILIGEQNSYEARCKSHHLFS